MKKKVFKRLLSMLVTSGVVLSLAACGGGDNVPAIGASGAESASAASENGVPTISLYPSAANLQSGVVGGFKGEYFAERGFNVDVWAYSDEKTNAILASGDLPDVMYIPANRLDTMIESGMLLNLDDYLDKMPHLKEFKEAEPALNYIRKFKSAGTGSIYGLTTDIGTNYAKYKMSDSTERNALKLRWDVYDEIGAPEINSMDDVLDVMEKMLKAHPTEEDGTTCYGTVLNNGSDSEYFANMTMWYRMQGYKEDQLPYLLEADMVNGKFTSILDKDSMYYKGLKWYNEAYRRGLMDPDSINNDRPTQKVKVDNGYAMVPSGYLPGWADKYLEYYVPGTHLYYNYDQKYGNSNVMIGINANTENLDACLKFLDMLCDPDAFLWVRSGPEGEIWQVDENGVASLTDKAIESIKINGSERSGFTLESGEVVELWNTPWIIANGVETKYKDKDGNFRCCTTAGWPEMREFDAEKESFKAWQKTTGYNSWQELLQDKGALTTSSDLDNLRNFTSIPDDTMKLTIDAIKDKVVNASWQMVYAKDDASFDELWQQMVSDCEGLGAKDIIEWRLNDIENAKKIRDSLG
ncbi:hypothetical protein [Oribacterium sp. WCC10]|uniref:hypothetical protein n=1 Tax=Oribacterium sp. WCC10 TaxID=1855343 RepID=UPI0008ED0C78|nr:hypothetical protein [Oribacterium sp. WCC10]SFG43336.1 hypothetical protein SAMN05216356_108110 [Oribacterium sp. WCC10]